MNHSSQWAELRAVWLVIHHEPWPSTLCTDSWVVLRELTLRLGQREAEGWMIMNKPLWGQDRWEDTWLHLQAPETVLTVFHVQAHRALTLPGNQDADVPARVRALTSDPSVDTADRVHRKSGPCRAQVGWSPARDARWPLMHVTRLMQSQHVLCILNNTQGNCQRSLGSSTRVPNKRQIDKLITLIPSL